MKPDVNRLLQGLETQYGTGIRRQLQQALNQQSYQYPQGAIPLRGCRYPTWMYTPQENAPYGVMVRVILGRMQVTPLPCRDTEES